MSLATPVLAFLAIKPKVWVDGARLMARSSKLVQALSLLSYCKEVQVNQARKQVVITVRRLWVLVKTREIAFDEIDGITYKFGSLATSWSMWMGRTDQVESFAVCLKLRPSRREVKLFSFMGEGAVATGMTGVFLGEDSLVDYSGDQEDASKNFVELLQRFTGKSLTV